MNVALLPLIGVLTLVAEVVGLSWPRGIAIGGLAAGVLVDAVWFRERRAQRPAIVAASLVFAATWLTHSPVLGLVATALFLTGVGWGGCFCRWLPLLGLGSLAVQILSANYFSVFGLDQLPRALALLLSVVGGRTVFATRTQIFVGGTAVSWSLLSLSAALVVFGSFAVLFPSGSAVRMCGRLVVALTLSLVIGTFVAIVVVGLHQTGWFFTHWWFILWVGLLYGIGLALWPRAESPIDHSWGAWAAVTLVATILLWGFPAFDARSLRIVFDESHGQWETTTGPFDTTKYGRDTVYNYRLLRDWLSRRHQTFTTHGPIDRIDADVVIVKTPTEPYTDQERQTIQHFVADGGTLLVIGDHTNLFGTSLVINDLLSAYGLRIRSDATVPWSGSHYDFNPAWWHRHTLMRGIDRIEFQTGATIESSSPLTVPFLVGYRQVAETAEYSNERFFAELQPTPDDRQAPLVMGAYRWYGAGRVFLFSDSTILSNFSLMMPGNSDLIQNIIESRGRRGWLMILAVICLVGGTGLLSAKGVRARLLFVLAAVPVVFAGGLVGASGSINLPKYPGAWVDIDGKHSHFEARADTRSGAEADLEDYSTFLAWVGRKGILTRVDRQRPFSDAAIPTIILNPDQPFSVEDLDDIEHYVRRGGHLLILDDPQFHQRSTVGSVLDRFGITLRPILVQDSVHDVGSRLRSDTVLGIPFDLLDVTGRAPGSARLWASGIDYSVIGAPVLLTDERGTTIAVEQASGKGRVLVFARSSLFSEFVLGDVWGGQDVAPEKERLYKLEYDLLERLMSGPKQ